MIEVIENNGSYIIKGPISHAIEGFINVINSTFQIVGENTILLIPIAITILIIGIKGILKLIKEDNNTK